MNQALTLPRTTIGLKAIMGISGAAMLGFLIAHLLGNLLLWAGPEAINEYAASLRRIPFGGLWVLRLGLVGAVIAHVSSAVLLYRRNQDARPVKYTYARKNAASTPSSRSMNVTGTIVIVYIIYHLLHLTFGKAGGYYDHQNVYNNLVYGFQNPIIALSYVVANGLLGLHLLHGAWAWFNSLGLNHPRYNAAKRLLATGVTAFIVGGNIALPMSVLTGVVKPTEKTFCFPELAKSAGECDGFGAN